MATSTELTTLDPPLIHQLARDLLGLTGRIRERAAEDPFGNPVLSIALAISRRLDQGALTEDALVTLIHFLRDAAQQARAQRLASYVGGVDPTANEAVLDRVASHAASLNPAFDAFQAATEHTRFAAVFTAHPTFALAPEAFRAIAEMASGRTAPRIASHRPARPSLDQEFAAASAAIANGRDAIDRLAAALLRAARDHWPERWTELTPHPIVLATWVGYDTDGRTDIGWWDTLRLRLSMKRMQLARVAGQVGSVPAATLLTEQLATAVKAVDAQIAALPHTPDPDAVAAFAAVLIRFRDQALVSPLKLLPLFQDAIAASEDEDRLALAVARAGLVGHGMSLAHTHTRLNASQIHNTVRMRLGLAEPPADPSRRRVLLAAINAALDSVQPVPVDFGALLAEQASAARLMMVVAQIAKHVDASAPIRFLIAETESGYTLLAALWLARLFGLDRQIEISPLFETADALERGARVLEEALRSPHWRAYLRQTGRMALQFGYSDSGRYVGQVAASYRIERLRLRVIEALARHDMNDIEVVLFDTHGESIGRGAHPGSLADRLTYLAPTASRQAFARAGITVREESSFQGGDGYLLFGSPELALASISRIAEDAFADVPATTDPIYDDPDFAADFFELIAVGMGELVEDRGYAALLGAFGPALLDPSGSRPSARQTDGGGGPATIQHPRELRAIPNNAILQQLGWCANTLHGVGEAASHHPEPFTELRHTSPRFHRALDLVAHALAHSDIDVLRATIAMLDPGTWLDRAAQATLPGRRSALVAVARALERLDLWAPAQSMFRRVQADHLRLSAAWPGAAGMADREVLLHALRLTLIQRIWLLATEVPEFSPRDGITWQGVQDRLIRLDVPATLALVRKVFPVADRAAAGRSFAEPPGPASTASYTHEQADIVAPIGRMFDMVRELGTAITHEVGAFG